MNKDCTQCKGSGLVADLPAFPKPAWTDYENRPRGGPDPMTDFVKPVPCPTCCPEELAAAVALGPTEFVRSVHKDLRAKAVEYRKKAETIDGLAEVAEGLTPGSNAEKAFLDLIKTQGVDL